MPWFGRFDYSGYGRKYSMKVKFSELNLREQVAAINAIHDLKTQEVREGGFSVDYKDV